MHTRSVQTVTSSKEEKSSQLFESHNNASAVNIHTNTFHTTFSEQYTYYDIFLRLNGLCSVGVQ